MLAKKHHLPQVDVHRLIESLVHPRRTHIQHGKAHVSVLPLDLAAIVSEALCEHTASTNAVLAMLAKEGFTTLSEWAELAEDPELEMLVLMEALHHQLKLPLKHLARLKRCLQRECNALHEQARIATDTIEATLLQSCAVTLLDPTVCRWIAKEPPGTLHPLILFIWTVIFPFSRQCSLLDFTMPHHQCTSDEVVGRISLGWQLEQLWASLLGVAVLEMGMKKVEDHEYFADMVCAVFFYPAHTPT